MSKKVDVGSREQMDSRLEARMLSGEPFTYKELKGEFTNDDDHYRIVDLAIQRLRRRGLITYRREGRLVIWAATPNVA